MHRTALDDMHRIKYIYKDLFIQMQRTICIDTPEWKDMPRTDCTGKDPQNNFHKQYEQIPTIEYYQQNNVQRIQFIQYCAKNTMHRIKCIEYLALHTKGQ